MKKVIMVLMALVFCFSFVGCGNKEYDALFERFKAQLKEQKDKLKKDKDGSAAFYCTLWHRKIKGEREDLENKIHSSLKG